MPYLFAPCSPMDRIFVLAAALGGLGVGFRILSMVLGGFHDWGGLAEGAEGAEPGDGFQVLSLHGLSSFFLMFGLVGLALSRQWGAAPGPAFIGGFLAGLAALLSVARLFSLAHGLQSSGTLPVQAAAGCLGTIYQRIPPGGTGRVTVKIGQRLREMDAIHAGGGELPTGTPVRVVRVEQSLAVVQPHSHAEAACPNP